MQPAPQIMFDSPSITTIFQTQKQQHLLGDTAGKVHFPESLLAHQVAQPHRAKAPALMEQRTAIMSVIPENKDAMPETFFFLL